MIDQTMRSHGGRVKPSLCLLSLLADVEALASAQLNCVHLMHTMAKLLPGWLPRPLYSIVRERWRSTDFQARCTGGRFLGRGGLD